VRTSQGSDSFASDDLLVTDKADAQQPPRNLRREPRRAPYISDLQRWNPFERGRPRANRDFCDSRPESLGRCLSLQNDSLQNDSLWVNDRSPPPVSNLMDFGSTQEPWVISPSNSLSRCCAWERFGNPAFPFLLTGRRAILYVIDLPSPDDCTTLPSHGNTFKSGWPLIS